MVEQNDELVSIILRKDDLPSEVAEKLKSKEFQEAFDSLTEATQRFVALSKGVSGQSELNYTAALSCALSGLFESRADPVESKIFAVVQRQYRAESHRLDGCEVFQSVAEIIKQKRIPYSYVCSPKVSLFFMKPEDDTRLRATLLPYWPLLHLPSTEFQHLLTQQQ